MLARTTFCEGRIGIIDPDLVELSNLQRQILHNEKSVGMAKVHSAAQALESCVSLLESDNATTIAVVSIPGCVWIL